MVQAVIDDDVWALETLLAHDGVDAPATSKLLRKVVLERRAKRVARFLGIEVGVEL